MQMKNIAAAIALAASAAIVGCASLDERLASTDPRVKNEAEHELIASSRENGDEAMRVAAVKRVTNKDYLYEIAMDAKPTFRTPGGKTISTTAEGLAAFGQLALDGKTVDGLKKLIALVANANSTEVRIAALNEIAGQNAIGRSAAGNSNPKVRQAAWARLNSEAGFAVVAKGAIDEKMQSEAFGKLKDQKTIDEVVLKTSNRAILLSGMPKVSDKAALASRVFSKDFIGDKEVTCKFISGYADDALLVKIVKEHGEALSSEQFATIRAKSKNAEVQNAIAALADKKVLSEIKTLKENAVKNEIQRQYDKSMAKLKEEFRRNAVQDESNAKDEFRRGKKHLNGWRKEISEETLNARLNDSGLVVLLNNDSSYDDLLTECLRMFAKIESVELRTHFVTNEFGRFERFDADRIVPCLKDEDVVSLFKAYDDDIYRRELIIERINNERIIPLTIALIKSKAPWDILRKRLAALKDVSPEEVCKIIDVRPKAASVDDMQVFCDIVKQGSIDESFISRIKVTDIGRGIGNSSNNGVRKLVQTVFAKLNADAKKKLCAAARKKATEQKGRAVVFGPFYMGMPYLDALLLQGEIWGAGNGIGIWSNFKEKGEYGVFDMASVWKISFSNNAKFKFIDCKDSLVLPQFIHQFIEGKSGKVSSDFGYVNDIQREYDQEYDRIYRSYRNSKLGIKVQYCQKDGVLNMVEL